MLSGLFESQRLIFAFHLTTMIMQHDGKLTEEELDFFLKGSNTLSEGQAKPNELSWIPDSGWNDLDKVVKISASFKGFKEHILAESQVSTPLFDNACKDLQAQNTDTQFSECQPTP